MIRAIDFEIKRNLQANGRVAVPLPRKPIRVATLLNEELFLKDQVLEHNVSVFLEDRVHDWNWHEGVFYFYTRVAAECDLIIVYEEDRHYTRKPELGSTAKP